MVIKERRSGNFEVLAKVLVWVLLATATAATTWAVMTTKVNDNIKTTNSNTTDIKALDNRVRITEGFMLEQKVQNAWTRETLTRIDEKLQ